MLLQIREISLLYVFSAALTAIIAISPALALSTPGIILGDGPTDASGVQSQLVTVERSIGLVLLCLCSIFLLAHRRKSAARRGAAQTETSTGAGVAPPAWPFRCAEGLAVFLPALPLLAYLWIFSTQAYESLFLGDQDFTNISMAISQTARGNGILNTPFLATGPSGSYLGHHFSPLLILYAPAYELAEALISLLSPEALDSLGWQQRPTHLLYSALLWGTLACGLFFWSRLVHLEVGDAYSAVLLMATMCSAYPLWRLALSYHYEAPVLPLSALCFLAMRRGGRIARCLFWLWLILWMSNKEDIALYVGLFGLYLTLHKGEGPASGRAPFQNNPDYIWRGPLVMALALGWLLVALLGLDYFGGPERVNWVRMWSEKTPFSEHSLRPSGLLILAFAALPLLNLRFSVLVLLPIMLFHFVSQQAWHHNYLGHYSYAILPFLMFGAIRGYQRLQRLATIFDSSLDRFASPGRIAGAAILACSFFAASADRYMPLPGLAPDPRFAIVEQTLSRLPSGACLQTQSPFSAHAPLDVQVYPLMIDPGNPAYESMPGPHNFDRFHFERPNCRGYYLFLDVSDPAPPYYSAEHLEAFAEFARRNLLPVSEREGMTLYRLPVFGSQ